MVLLVLNSYYESKTLDLVAVDNAYVTSTTPLTSENYFINEESGFHTSLTFQNCTLIQAESFGVIYMDSSEPYATEANNILDMIYEELAEIQFTNMKAKFPNDEINKFTKRTFSSNEEVEKFAKSHGYTDNEICFAFGWHIFNPDEHEYAFDLRFNYGDVPEARLP